MNLTTDQLLYSGEELDFRVIIFVFEIETSFVHFLENRVDSMDRSVIIELDQFASLEVALHRSLSLVLASELADDSALMHSDRFHPIVLVEDDAESTLEAKVAAFRGHSDPLPRNVGEKPR